MTALPDPVERPVLSVEEAGQAVGLGRSAAYEAVRRGEIPSLRFGRRRVVPTAALRALLGLDGGGEMTSTAVDTPTNDETPRAAGPGASERFLIRVANEGGSCGQRTPSS